MEEGNTVTGGAVRAKVEKLATAGRGEGVEGRVVGKGMCQRPAGERVPVAMS